MHNSLYSRTNFRWDFKLYNDQKEIKKDRTLPQNDNSTLKEALMTMTIVPLWRQ